MYVVKMNKILALLFCADTKVLNIQILRFIVVGISTVFLDFTTLIGLVEILKVNYLVAATIGFFVGSIANYFLSVKFVFEVGKYSNKMIEFVIFIIITIIGLILNYFIMYFFTDILLFSYVIAKIISLFIVTISNFLMKKFLVFKG